MSSIGNTALARPLRRAAAEERKEREERQRPQLEIAPTRAQRRARPRLLPAVVSVAGIGVILLAQLGLSLLLADGAYQIERLENTQRDLLRDEQALSEDLEILSSTQNLTANAEALGMVASGNPQFLDVSSGAVTGSSSAPGVDLAGGANMIGNALLDGSTVIDPAALAAAQAAEAALADTGAPTVQGQTSVVPTTPAGPLPSPTTH